VSRQSACALDGSCAVCAGFVDAHACFLCAREWADGVIDVLLAVRACFLMLMRVMLPCQRDCVREFQGVCAFDHLQAMLS
jgi:hypothetical protein